MCDLVRHGRIVSIDIEHRKGRPEHGRIQYLLGSSTTQDTVQRVKQGIGPKDSVMVILDSDHRAAHVRDELKTYAPLVTKGQYLIVEDTNVNGHPVFHHHGPGPMEALLEFLEGDQDFVIDEEKEKFLLTFNPRGYLLKVRP
jgi:cephalosporin hydroxylase